MSNTVACETLDAMCAVCGAHCATWVGEDEHGDRYYTLDACDDSGERFIVHSYDLMEAVITRGELVRVGREDGQTTR